MHFLVKGFSMYILVKGFSIHFVKGSFIHFGKGSLRSSVDIFEFGEQCTIPHFYLA